MRSQGQSSGQQSGSSDQQKKSVFERLGHQVDASIHSFKRRSSPSYNDCIPPTSLVHSSGPMQDSDFSPRGYGPRVDPNQSELDWRYQNERGRGHPPFPNNRHIPNSLGPPLPPFSYGMDVPSPRQSANFFGPQHPYGHNQPPPGMSPPHQLPPSGLPSQMVSSNMNMYPRRTSPKYDRHPNSSFKDRSMRIAPMEPHHYPGPPISPPRMYMGQGPGPIHPRDMHPNMNMYAPQPPTIHQPRWNDLEPDFTHGPPGMPRMMPQSRRFGPSEIPSGANGNPFASGEHTRYNKWRERRDAITNLDRETAQSSFQTNSLKSSLQQAVSNRNDQNSHIKQVAQHDTKNTTHKSSNEPDAKVIHLKRQPRQRAKPTKTDPQDISDGEIVDDESSSLDECDDNEILSLPISKDKTQTEIVETSKPHQPELKRESSSSDGVPNKKKSRSDREQYSLDYETISDEDLDDFMEGKKDPETEVKPDDKTNENEIELLNALGIDWANLVEMAKETRALTKRNATVGSSLSRFNVANYIPTLGISFDLAGPELSDIIRKLCRT